MGLLDKAVAAMSPEATPEQRAAARAHARSLGKSGWLSMVLDQHEATEAAFVRVKAAGSATTRRVAQKALSVLLTGHSLAEEAVLYPAMALHDQKAHSGEAFTEQSAAKVQIAALDELEPMSQDYLDKLEHLRAAVAHHVYEEESEWFPALRGMGDTTMQTKLSRRYREEYERYANG
jgi:NADH dehydrogenase/NADH:ubiquinone oxidoreductase subunit G